MTIGDSLPASFFEVVVHEPDSDPGLMGLCAGYECDEWRCPQLARHLIEWLPDFALSDRELSKLSPGNMVEQLRTAAKLIYDTDKYGRRGEFGELLLHAVLRRHLGTLPAIKKIFYKDSRNDTVKGFDAVHVVPTTEGLELWLGEVKFYSNAGDAIRAVVEELRAHTERDYLRNEFLLIRNKTDSEWPFADKLAALTDGNTSLDNVFEACVFPALLTYDSQAISDHTRATKEYRAALEAEFKKHHASFKKSGLPGRIRLHLILVPLKNKKELIGALHARLEAAQGL